MIRNLCFPCLLLVTAIGSLSADEIRILPDQFTLHGVEGRQRVSVVSVRDGRISASVPSDQIVLESSDPKVVEIQDGVATAISNGTTTLVVRTSDGREASATVRVVGAGRAHVPVAAGADC